MQFEFLVSASMRQELIDITKEINEIVRKSKVGQGICNIFALHATAAIVINENADPDICLDLLDAMKKIAPGGIWRHDKIDDNADSHIKSAMLSPDKTIPIKNNQLYLGTWQSIMLAELDGPRNRKIIVTILGD